jgi:hypothetical protein
VARAAFTRMTNRGEPSRTEKMLAEGDPIATGLFRQYKQVRMPNVELGTDDVAAVLSGAPAARADQGLRNILRSSGHSSPSQ